MIENPMTNEREAQIREAYLAKFGKVGAVSMMQAALKDTLEAVKTGNEPLITVTLGGLLVICDLLADALNIDTTPFEILMLESLQAYAEQEEETADEFQ